MIRCCDKNARASKVIQLLKERCDYAFKLAMVGSFSSLLANRVEFIKEHHPPLRAGGFEDRRNILRGVTRNDETTVERFTVASCLPSSSASASAVTDFPHPGGP